MGVDVQGRKGEGEQMAPLSILILPKEFQEHWARMGRRESQEQRPNMDAPWQGKGKQHGF